MSAWWHNSSLENKGTFLPLPHKLSTVGRLYIHNNQLTTECRMNN